MNHERVMNDPVFLSKVMSSGPGLVIVVRRDDLKIVFSNDLLEHFLGYTQADVDGGEFYFTNLVEQHQCDRLKFQLDSVITSITKRTSYTIYNLIDKKGVKAPFYLFASPVPKDDPIEDAYFYLLLMPDNSKWSMPYTSYDTRELFFEQFKSEDFGTFEWIVDVDKTIWSSGVYKIYEVDESFNDITRGFAAAFIHPDDIARVGPMSVAAMHSGEALDVELRIITAKGNIKTIHSLARMIVDSDGKPVKFVGSVRDISRRRNIEIDLKKKVEELYHSNKELEEFAYVASHDMQEPLRKITTFSSRLMEKYKDVLTGEGAMYLDRMTASAENMRVLINDLLEFSRIANTQLPFMRLDLNSTLRQVLTDLELVIEETGTQVNSDTLPVVDAIPSQMKQLFANIISNAIKFRKKDAQTVITIVSGDLDNATKLKYELKRSEDYSYVKISDNGIGFEAEYASRIFNVFQRLHGKADYPGSGIGLAICKKILEHHNGIIYAESMPGEGASFTFAIPKINMK